MIEKNLYMFWTGENELTENRKETIKKVSDTCGVNLFVLNKDNISLFEKVDSKFHKAYRYLSYTHRSDYLRCYFMHFYGGCYSDIKITTFNWLKYINILDNEKEKDIIGYSEESPNDIGISPGDPEEKEMRTNFSSFIGNCSYICKKNTMITTQWFNILNKILDEKFYLLQQNPASHPQDYYGKIIDGKYSTYPLMWTEICGNIFHKVCFQNTQRVLHGLPRPICINYR